MCPVFLQFIEKIENRGKVNLMWQVNGIYSTWRMSYYNLPCFSIIP